LLATGEVRIGITVTLMGNRKDMAEDIIELREDNGASWEAGWFWRF